MGTGWERGLDMEIRSTLEVIMSLLRIYTVPELRWFYLPIFQLTDDVKAIHIINYMRYSTLYYKIGCVT